MQRYWRVNTETGGKNHYAKERDGKPELFTMCGIQWLKAVGPAATKLPGDCKKCKEFVWRPIGGGAKTETLDRQNWIKED